MADRHRRCVILRGRESETAALALEQIDSLPPESVLWVSDDAVEGRVHTAPAEVKRSLGVSYDVVVLDVHRGIDADLLGQCHGFIWGGGCLILRMPPLGQRPQRGQQRFAVHPYTTADVNHRFYDRFEAALARSPFCGLDPIIRPATRVVHGTEEQTAVVGQLSALFSDRTPHAAVILSDRGRGKSSALGLALKSATEAYPLSVVVTAANQVSTAEVFRFAGHTDSPEPAGNIEYIDATELAHSPGDYDVIVIDEAAQLSVQLLQRIVRRHSDACIALATTARGYEGTGRGFVLRFLEWLKLQDRPVSYFSLIEPIRWAANDPLESFIYDALLLDAIAAPAPRQWTSSEIAHVVIDRDDLREDEQLLRDYFGLLVHAHYRTTPSDLHRILDAPNLRLHTLMLRGRIVAATLVAVEGELPDEMSEALYWGRTRARGNALAETLISHSGHQEAGALSMIRSIRIAVHPELRRRGLATTLVDHIHQTYQPDLFGTLFGVTPELLEFRRKIGYEVVRIGASRGSRTGEPAVVMLRPVSPRGEALFNTLRREMARDLPYQFSLHTADGQMHLDPRLEVALRADLPSPAPLTDDLMREAVAAFSFGPRTVESTALALATFVRAHTEQLDRLSQTERRLIEGRILEHKSWTDVMEETGLPSLPATMRAIRRAMRRFAQHAAPDLEQLKPVAPS
jgi:tRNA(Met) cytidine acetyltransferase